MHKQQSTSLNNQQSSRAQKQAPTLVSRRQILSKTFAGFFLIFGLVHKDYFGTFV